MTVIYKDRLLRKLKIRYFMYGVAFGGVVIITVQVLCRFYFGIKPLIAI